MKGKKIGRWLGADIDDPRRKGSKSVQINGNTALLLCKLFQAVELSLLGQRPSKRRKKRQVGRRFQGMASVVAMGKLLLNGSDLRLQIPGRKQGQKIKLEILGSRVHQIISRKALGLL